jgi:hypothetical protein
MRGSAGVRTSGAGVQLLIAAIDVPSIAKSYDE